ncbi:hypothetical protein N7468_007578 [Penicillium chermesinum]|uniref:NADP-dependent oxidoreductase domain-containing protein n=1 Tax=Penicillium chermesinum TaxID=63820 RepID=A0A9W9TKS8_9EURO|nr:uncharacterized protein N7468_007578 [Penicillium chermesinum]KAJ5226353.1 hypothetical protein N7468_007578 [Penicillium chermesinum]
MDPSSQPIASTGSHAPEPDKPRMQYQRLGNSGLKVSRIILGCMSYGNPNWEGSPWVLDEAQSLPLIKKAYDMGINTFDTANTYSNGRRVVIMTKIYYPVLEDDPDARPQPATNDGPLVNQMGLSRKHIFDAVEGSLRRLQSDYIDVLQLHRFDSETPGEEIMRALHDLVQVGKVRYLGASSMHCWEFARLQYTAKMHGWTPFAEGVGLVPWSPLARGLLARPWQEKSTRADQDLKTKRWFVGDANECIVRRVEEIARRKGCGMGSVAICWLLQKGACPVVGLNSVHRIEAAVEALQVTLTPTEVALLEEAYRPLGVQAI